MKISKETKADIIKKKGRLEELSIHLKDKFVGLDDIIDNVVNSISPFYLFSESINRPIVVNLWGMTGTGKTSLIEETINFLNLNHCYVKFDVGEYCDTNDALRKELATKIKKVNGSKCVLLFDEFQLGRTIDENGSEIDRNSLRPIWELIDTGIIYTHNTGVYMGLVDLIDKMKKCHELGVELDKDGYVIKKEDVYDSMFRDDYAYVPFDYKECFVLEEADEYDEDEVPGSNKDDKDKDGKDSKDKDEPKYVDPNSTRSYWYDTTDKFKKPRFIKKEMFDYYLYRATPNFFDGLKDFPRHAHMFQKTLPQLIQFIQNDFLEMIDLTKKVDFSKSVIFCVGNLDELYKGDEHNVSPDEDADKFHELSLDITLPEVKKALSRRFRMEQIGRLGNTHYIYPTLNVDSYKKLIQKYLDSKVIYAKEDFKLKLIFDESINKALYDEGVYPSQGTRPLLSTFNSMIESYLTRLITELSLNFDSAKKIEWSYKSQEYTMVVTGKKGVTKTYKYPVECKLEILRESTASENQALTAVHEAGHALVSCLTTNIAPIEVLSRTADISEGVCKHDYKDLIYTKKFLLQKLIILLAGLEAEKLIFGEEFCSIGAGSDLAKATDIAFSTVKAYGMSKYPALMSSDIEASQFNKYVKVTDDSLEEEVLKILNTAKEECVKILKENEKYLLLLSEKLVIKSKILEDDVKEVLEPLNIEWKTATTLHSFKNVISEGLEKHMGDDYKPLEGAVTPILENKKKVKKTNKTKGREITINKTE